jgi:hypothetical protein
MHEMGQCRLEFLSALAVVPSRNRTMCDYIQAMVKTSSVVTVRPRRASPLLICKKCLRRVDFGKKIKRSLKWAVKRQSRGHSLRPARVVMTSCFGICPKHGVVLTNGSKLRRGEYLLVSDSNSVADAAALLMRPEKS